jgi:hypothetical protein
MVDFTIFEGEDWDQVYEYQDNKGSGIDITGADILFVAKAAGKSDIIKSVGGGVTIDPDQGINPGQFTVSLSDSDTTTLGGTAYSYEIKMTIGTDSKVIYPVPNATVTFSIIDSLTDGVTP